MDALSTEPLPAAVPPEQVVGIVDLVPALAEDGTAVLLADLPGGGLHPGGVRDLQPGEDLCLGDIRGQDGRQRQQLARQRLDRLGAEEIRAGGRDHDGVDDDMTRAVLAQLLSDHADQLRHVTPAPVQCLGTLRDLPADLLLVPFYDIHFLIPHIRDPLLNGQKNYILSGFRMRVSPTLWNQTI